jgi:hypothetical protein
VEIDMSGLEVETLPALAGLEVETLPPALAGLNWVQEGSSFTAPATDPFWAVNKRRLIPLARVGKTMTYDAYRRRNPSPIHISGLTTNGAH